MTHVVGSGPHKKSLEGDRMLKETAPSLKSMYTPEEFKTLVDALNLAPAYLSKRFILKNLCGWTDEMILENQKLRNEENNDTRLGSNNWR